ncbi:MAG: PDZ domain-containing protein, partial [Chloroflexota bacterium]|nr:PDZ domain-containing protein [Chloroflexota bacterium]
VGRVRDDSPSGQAGVTAGDVIVEMSGRPVASAADLEKVAAARPPGMPTSLVVRRGNERVTLILR